MNSFLLTIAAILVVALAALFAVPLFIDWNDYRPAFESQASRLLGRGVKVGGDVHLVLLPAPEFRFDDVEVADANGRFDKPLLKARSFEALLNIGGLVNGMIEARALTITDPVLRLTLKADGTGDWTDIGSRRDADLSYTPTDVALDQVEVKGGRLELVREGGRTFIIDQIDGEASAPSLAGPYKVAAGYVFQGRRQDLHFSTTTIGAADKRLHLKAALRNEDGGTSYLLDGDVSGLNGKPAYDGTFQAALTGAPLAPKDISEPEKDIGDAGLAAQDTASGFELKGDLHATPDRAELPNFDLTVHAKGRPQLLKGKLTLTFGDHPRADGALSAHWIDIDTLLAAEGERPESANASPPLTQLADALLKVASNADGTLSLQIEQASLAGDLLANLNADLATDPSGIAVRSLKAELPGDSHMEAAGELKRTANGAAFVGPVKLSGARLKTLLRWASEDSDVPGNTATGAFSLAGDATIAPGDLRLEHGTGVLNGTKFNGGFQYAGGAKPVLDIDLDSDRLDLRDVLSEGVPWHWPSTVGANAQQTSGKPEKDTGLLSALGAGEARVSLHVGELLLPKTPAGKLDTHFTLLQDTLDIQQLDFLAAGALTLDAKGHIEHLSTAPSGRLDLALDAETADSLRNAAMLGGVSDSLIPAKSYDLLVPLNLKADLLAAPENGVTKTSLALEGRAADAALALNLHSMGDVTKLADADIAVDGAVTDTSQTLLGLLFPSLPPEKLAALTGRETRVAVKLNGIPAKSVQGHVELAAGSMHVAYDGESAWRDDGVSLDGRLSGKTEDASLAIALAGLDPPPSAAEVPLDLGAKLTKSARVFDMSGISGTIGGKTVDGTLHLDLSGDKTKLDASASAQYASLPSLLGLLVAWKPVTETDAALGAVTGKVSDVWPAHGFALGAVDNSEGTIKLNAKTLSLGGPLQLDDASLEARLGADGLSLQTLKGQIFGGSFAASALLAPKGAGAELTTRADLTGGQLDLASQAIFGKVLAKGPFALTFNLSGEGLSPPGLVADLSGEGTLSVEPGVIQNLNVDPLRRLAPELARNRRVNVDKDQIAALSRQIQGRLTRGTYRYEAASLPFEVKNGAVKLKPAVLASDGAEADVSASIELASLSFNSAWGLRVAESAPDFPAITLVFAGPLANANAIQPAIDTEPIESYMTVRRMQEDVERLENLDVSGHNAQQGTDTPNADAPPVPRSPASRPAAPRPPAPVKSSALPPEPQPAAPKSGASAPVASVPPAAAATPYPPEAADLGQDAGNAGKGANPAAQAPQVPYLEAPTAASPDAASGSVDSLLPPAAPVAKPVRPRRPPENPDDWRKSVPIFGGG